MNLTLFGTHLNIRTLFCGSFKTKLAQPHPCIDLFQFKFNIDFQLNFNKFKRNFFKRVLKLNYISVFLIW